MEHATLPQLHDQRPVDVAVIGGGIAGLSAAIEALRAGSSVLVLEATSHPGGRARSEVRDGCTFNIGPHALYVGGPGWSALHDFGIVARGAMASVGGHAILDSGLTPLPLGPVGAMRTRALSARGKVELARLMRSLMRVDARSHDGDSWSTWLDEHVTRDDVRRLLLAVSRLTTFSHAPDLVSAGAILAQVQLATANGVLYLDGGWQQLVDALADRVRGLGGQVRTGALVTSVERDSDGDGWIVHVGGSAVRARSVVVSAGGPRVAERLLGLGDRTLAHAGPPARLAVLDVVLPAVPPRRFLLGLDEPTYFATHGPPAALAPENRAVASAARYLAADDDTPWGQQRDQLRRVVEQTGTPEVIDERFFAHLTVTGGQPLAHLGGCAGRPGVSAPGVPGAFLAGDWVGPEGLLSDASFASGRAAGRAAARATHGGLSEGAERSRLLR